MVSVGDGKVMGVNRGNAIFARTGVNRNTLFGKGWRRIAGSLKHISAGDGKIM